MIKILQFIVVFLDLSTVCFFLLALLYTVIAFFQQIYIRIHCKYRGLTEKPGRGCVTCDYQEECGRAWESQEYQHYFFNRTLHPDQAQALFDEIQAEEDAKSK